MQGQGRKAFTTELTEKTENRTLAENAKAAKQKHKGVLFFLIMILIHSLKTIRLGLRVRLR